MSDTAVERDSSVEHVDHDDHPSDFTYIKIAVFLAVITGLEVTASYLDLGNAFVPIMIVLMSVKFGVVAAFFMHLKLDNRILTWVFVAGLAFAVAVYVATLSTFQFWE